MKDLRSKVVVITGAASGIGRALALKFAKKGANLALCDLNGRELERVSWDAKVLGVKIYHQVVDVSVPEQLQNFRDNIVSTFGVVDVVINNAGVSLSETVMQAKVENTKWLMNINMFGVLYGSQIFLRDLLCQKEARLVNVSSIFGVVGVPSQSAYCASKFAVRGFTESLQAELIGTTVKVILVMPGGVRTNIVRNGRHAYDARGNPTNREALAQLFDSVAMTSPEGAADAIVKAVQKPCVRLVIGSDAKLIDLLARVFPRWIYQWTARAAAFGARTRVNAEVEQPGESSNNKRAV